MKQKRNIMIITGSRGEYGYIRPVIKEIEKRDDLKYTIVATNMLLVPEFGYAINNFYEDDIEVKYKVDMSMSGYSNASMSKSLGIFMQSLTDIVSNETPSIILLAGDRGEQLVGAIVGAHMNVPVAHIQAGELSGNIDGMSRHAITKFAHIHFPANLDAEQRLEKMGEQKFRIYNTGAPQLDEFEKYNYLSKEELYNKFNLDQEQDFALLVQHSITEEAHLSEEQMDITLSAMKEVGIQTVLIYPNNDAGSSGVQKAIDKNNIQNLHIKRNLDREDYANLMNHASFMIGNSSSGLLEAPTFKLPAINIGRRQIGRLQAKNVVNVEFNKDDIVKSINKVRTKDFKDGLKSILNPYGDGKSAIKIVDILAKIEIDAQLLNKELTY